LGVSFCDIIVLSSALFPLTLRYISAILEVGIKHYPQQHWGILVIKIKMGRR